jgi:hypothetical protein
MNEGARTAAFWAAGVLLGLLAWATSPRVDKPATVADRGALFFPQFTDPNSAASLEVVEFNDQDGTVQPLKVLNRAGHWIIPSHHDYPADARDRLAQIAAAVIALRKDDFVSDNSADHERCGVLDPLDVALPGLKGRGTRVTVRGGNERLLADIIIGRTAPGHDEYRYVRLPGERRVYISRVGTLKISTAFGDWIERDRLQVDRDDIDRITVRNYSFDESTGRVTPRESLQLQRKGDAGWSADAMKQGEEVDAEKLNLLITNLVGLKIVGVLPKPAGISATLTGSAAGGRITTADREDLARKGFYLTDDGLLLSNEGEVLIHTVSGIFYTVRFGEVAPGTPEAPTSTPAAAAAPREGHKSGENRYLFIMATLDQDPARQSGKSTDEAAKRAALLRARFAPWYYIIPSDGFATIRARRADLVRPKGARRGGQGG